MLKFQIMDNQEIEGRFVPVQCGHYVVVEKCLMFYLGLTVRGCSGYVMNSKGNKQKKVNINHYNNSFNFSQNQLLLCVCELLISIS